MTSDQQRDDRGKERWLFLGSGLVIVVAMLVGLAREQRWGESMVRLRLISSNATGLRPGQEVRISGMPVGQVQRLKLQPDAAVAVEVEVANRYAALIGPNRTTPAGRGPAIELAGQLCLRRRGIHG